MEEVIWEDLKPAGGFGELYVAALSVLYLAFRRHFIRERPLFFSGRR